MGMWVKGEEPRKKFESAVKNKAMATMRLLSILEGSKMQMKEERREVAKKKVK